MKPLVAAVAVEISAPLEMVWAAMVDLCRYREWNPFIFEVADVPETLDVGDRFRLHVRWANGQTAWSWETLVALEPPAVGADGGVARARLAYRYSAWLAAAALVRSTREQTLSQAGGGATLYQTRETFHGALARWVPLSAVQEGFQRHAQALKRRAENA
jgi:hypothetical protein